MDCMLQRWVVVCTFLALAGCGPRPGPTATGPSQPATGGEVAKLREQLRQRELRIRTLEAQVGRLLARLRKLEFRCEQLCKQLEVVGDAPAQRDRYKRLSIKQALEIERLRQRINRLMQQIARSRPSTAAASQPAR